MDSSKTLKVCVKDTVFIGKHEEHKTYTTFVCPKCEVLVLRAKYLAPTNQANAPAIFYHSNFQAAF